MGLIANQARLLEITARHNDIEFEQQQVSSKRILLAIDESNISAEETNEMSEAGTSSDKLNSISEIYTAKLAPIQALDKVQELISTKLDTEHQALQTQLEATKKQIDYATGNKSVFNIFNAQG